MTMTQFYIKIGVVLYTCIYVIIGWAFGIPVPAYGEKVDMSKFTDEPVWSDEFDGDELDAANWTDHHGVNGTSIRRGGYWNNKMCEVSDGSLKIKTEYLEEGLDGGPAGYYTAGINTYGLFEHTFGYYEVRCKLPKGAGHWAAFWMLNDTMENVDGSGRDGAEIDVFEAPYYWKGGLYRNAVTSNIHIDGYGEDSAVDSLGRCRVKGDPYSEYHTYALEWNEDEYIIYVDGVQFAGSKFKGPSITPEYLILSVEVGGENGEISDNWSGLITDNNFLPTAFEIDYVRVYDYKN